MFELLTDLERLCPQSALRGSRVVRMTDQRVGRFGLDAQTLYELGSDNVGVLIAGSVSADYYIDQLQDLSALDCGGLFVVATASNALADRCYERLARPGSLRRRPDAVDCGCIRLTTPERLRKAAKGTDSERPVLAVILLDPYGIIHLGRGQEGHGWETNDRPQRIARYRFEQRRNEWQPPLLMLANKPARSLNSQQMLPRYGLDAWWFVDAATLRIGPAQRQPLCDSPELGSVT